MPMYEYECKSCGNVFDLLRNMNQDDSDVVCTQCGAKKVQRKLSVIASVAKSESSAMADFSGGDSCSSGLCGCSGPSCSIN
jgi:putative FmdB family regulatory protein